MNSKNQCLRVLLSLFLLADFSASANMIGSDAQNFSPTQDGLDFVTVHSSETLDPGILNLGFFVNYAQNTFPAYEGGGPAPNQSVFDKNDSFTSADINFAIGVSKNFQVGMSFPYVIDQTFDTKQNLGRFEGSGTSEIRGAAKFRITEDYKGWGIATVVSMNHNRIKNNPYVGDGAGPNFNLEFAADKDFGKWNFAFNLGHRWRDPGSPIPNAGIDPLPNQIIASAAGSYLLTSIDTKLILEIYGSQPTKSTSNLTNRQGSSFEALAGLKHDITRNLAFHVGGGTELGHGTSTPDWRVYSGINYAFGPVFDKVARLLETRSAKFVSFTVLDLQFEFNSAKLTPESKPVIDELVERIQNVKPINVVTVEGHTDSVGNAAYNQQLSLQRAETIKAVLIDRVPLPPGKVKAVGKGETEPIADNGNFQGRQKNRRVEVKVE
ncbi:MAG: OmpA family protein [Bdellovibrionaceae bacterium]|nr:OmpA family protein [Bdellovibrionales bacterium]MCB9083239.1 OmpA family protein [Pseudobdellovibrionaceae bacterium]